MTGPSGWDRPSRSDGPGGTIVPEPPAGSDRPSDDLGPEPPIPAAPDPPSDAHRAKAAVAVVIAVLGLLVAALVSALSFDLGVGNNDDVWKVKVKVAALNEPFGMGGGGTLVAVALLVALGLAGRRRSATYVGIAVCFASLWLGIATALDIFVNLTAEDGLVGAVVGAVIADLTTLLVLAAAGVWGAATASASR